MKPHLHLSVPGGEHGERVAVGDADDAGREVRGHGQRGPEGNNQKGRKAFHGCILAHARSTREPYFSTRQTCTVAEVPSTSR
jgi:hypothetical protein